APVNDWDAYSESFDWAAEDTVGFFEVSATGIDQPGIARAISKAAKDLQCNIVGSVMTVIDTYALILAVVQPGEGAQVTEDELSTGIEVASRQLGVSCRHSVTQLPEPEI